MTNVIHNFRIMAGNIMMLSAPIFKKKGKMTKRKKLGKVDVQPVEGWR